MSSINYFNVSKETILRNMMKNFIFHMTHIEHLQSIFKNGLLSHNNPYKKHDISNKDVNDRREKHEPIYNKSLHDYVPFYFNPRNAMLYDVQARYKDYIVILKFNRDILNKNGTIFSNSNAATNNARFTNNIMDLYNSNFIDWDEVYADSWNDEDLAIKTYKKQKMQAEALIQDVVPSSFIIEIICQNEKIVEQVKSMIHNNVNILVNQQMFFSNLISYEPNLITYKNVNSYNINLNVFIEEIKQPKYIPKTKEELSQLINNDTIMLDNIDTSLITDMSGLFKNSTRTNFNGIKNWNVQNVTNMAEMFYGCKTFNESLNNWNVSSVTNMSKMFYKCKMFNQSLNSWDISNVNNTESMFYECSNFNQPLNFWNTKNIIDMSWMFAHCLNFNQILNSWDISNVINMKAMFCDCPKFNQNLNSWNITKVDNMESMFMHCKSYDYSLFSWDLRNVKNTEKIFENSSIKKYYRYYPKTKQELIELINQADIYLGQINTSLVTDMSSLFCIGFNEKNEPIENTRNDFEGIEFWDLSNAKNISMMFAGCVEFNNSINNWKVSNVVNMCGVFYGCKKFNQILKDWKVDNVTNMSKMFYQCENFNQSLNDWNVENVEDMSFMFSDCINFNANLDKWNTKNVNNMAGMFKNCKNFNQLLNFWDLGNVNDISYMFYGCLIFNRPLSNWNVSNITNMDSVFCHCSNFNQILDTWDVSKVKNTRNMFLGCCDYDKSLDSWNLSDESNRDNMLKDTKTKVYHKYHPENKQELLELITNTNMDLSLIDTSKITDMSDLFRHSNRTNFAGIEYWEVENVIDMSNMFRDCIHFNQSLDSWNTSSVASMRNMFLGCENFNQSLDSWNVVMVRDMCGMFYGCTNFNQSLNSWKVHAHIYSMFEKCDNFEKKNATWSNSLAFYKEKNYL